MTAMGTSTSDWRAERRLDRVAAAQIDRENETARAQARIARAEAGARLKREGQQAKLADRRTARKQRAVRRAERLAWLDKHLLDLLFVPVIAVPAALAWTAMAAFGVQVFGAAGLVLPAFSEGAMWAFAAATTITRHRHPQRPVWHLRLGTVVFAAVGAALNFIHGMTPVTGQLRGPGVGAVMALVSVAGVVAHQFVTAGPRRSRAERDAAHLERERERRERRIRRAAMRRAVAEIDERGNARLVHRPGTVTLTRKHFRPHLEDVPVPQVTALPWPRPVPVFDVPVPATRGAVPEAAADAAQMPSQEPSEGATGEPSQRPRRGAARGPSAEPDAVKARSAYRKSVRDGAPLSDRALADLYGRSRTWGGKRIGECNAGPHLAAKTG